MQGYTPGRSEWLHGSGKIFAFLGKFRLGIVVSSSWGLDVSRYLSTRRPTILASGRLSSDWQSPSLRPVRLG
jgi:hypothetical protein